MQEYFALPEVQATMKRIREETVDLLKLTDDDIERLKKLSKHEFLVKVLPLIKNGMRRQAAEKSNFNIN